MCRAVFEDTSRRIEAVKHEPYERRLDAIHDAYLSSFFAFNRCPDDFQITVQYLKLTEMYAEVLRDKKEAREIASIAVARGESEAERLLTDVTLPKVERKRRHDKLVALISNLRRFSSWLAPRGASDSGRPS